MVQAGPSAPVASLPVLSEMIRRLDALDSMDSGRLNCSPEYTGLHQSTEAIRHLNAVYLQRPLCDHLSFCPNWHCSGLTTISVL